MTNKFQKFSLYVFFITISVPALAVPRLLTNQGHILNADNQPVTGVYDTTFKLYTTPTGSTAEWTEEIAISFDNGYYTVVLGATSSFPDSVFNQTELYLGVTLDTRPEFSPRFRLTSVPYSINCEALDSHEVSYFAAAEDLTAHVNDNETHQGSSGGGGAPPQYTNVDDLPNESDHDGEIAYVMSEGRMYFSDGTIWRELGELAPLFSSISPPQYDPDNTGESGIDATITGSSFKTGVRVQIGSQFCPVVNFVDKNQLTVKLPSLTDSGLYDITILNPSNLQAYSGDALLIDDTPTWVTDSDLGTVVRSDTSGWITPVVASDPEGEVTYSQSGDWPPGLTLSSSGDITGTAPDLETEYTFNFTIQATDSAPIPNTIDKDFSLTVTPARMEASGGTITTFTDSGITYTVHTFTSSGVFEVTNALPDGSEVDYLIVAGGGSGGADISGGGGGGGVLTGSFTVTPQSFSIVVGSGAPAAAGREEAHRGNKGSDSSALGLTAIGGGYGGGEGSSNGGSGGSGGGAGYSSGSGGSSTSGQGYAGGNCSSGTAGGGGGAGAVGENGSSGTHGGNGGSGIQSDIDGNNYYYGGGGGGSGYTSTNGSGGNGGIGGGGGSGGVGSSQPFSNPGSGGGSARNAGNNGSTNGDGGNGGANTGGGGGGTSESNGGEHNTSGAGGSGIVIIRYAR